jgi:hypothetical protein
VPNGRTGANDVAARRTSRPFWSKTRTSKTRIPRGTSDATAKRPAGSAAIPSANPRTAGAKVSSIVPVAL